jgi:lactate dehydrogenase-like 2-hydroxyacid dehydrogenase
MFLAAHCTRVLLFGHWHRTKFLIRSRLAPLVCRQGVATGTHNPRPTVFITTKIPKVAEEKLKQHCNLIEYWDSEEPLPRSELLKRAKNVDGIFCVLTDKIDKEFLDNAQKLKVVSTMSVGFDHIDIEECSKRGIKVGNTPGCLDETTADLVLALLLATARRIPEAVAAVKNGEWKPNWRPEWMCGTDVHGSTVGIIGLGRIGSAVARRLAGFNCQILYTGNKEKPEIARSLNAQFVPIDILLSQSDFVLPLVPLSKTTRGMINRDVFKKMKPTAFLINASRGPIVDQDALVDALKNNVIAGAGLDVTTPEPLPLDHPLLSPELSHKVVILPHIGSATYKTRATMALMAADNLIAGLYNRPIPHPVLTQ